MCLRTERYLSQLRKLNVFDEIELASSERANSKYVTLYLLYKRKLNLVRVMYVTNHL